MWIPFFFCWSLLELAFLPVRPELTSPHFRAFFTLIVVVQRAAVVQDFALLRVIGCRCVLQKALDVLLSRGKRASNAVDVQDDDIFVANVLARSRGS